MILNPLLPMQGSHGMPVLVRFPGVDMLGNLEIAGRSHVSVSIPGYLPRRLTVERTMVYGWAAR